MKPIIFSITNLIIGKTEFSLPDLRSIQKVEKKVDRQKGGNEHATITRTKEIPDRFFSVYFQEGDSMPRTNDVLSSKIESLPLFPNPRDKSQIEMYTQTFVLIDSGKQKIYFSNYQKKSMMRNWLGTKLGKLITIKDVINKKDFLESIRILDSISFSGEQSLFVGKSGILKDEVEKDIFGYGMKAAHIELSVKYKESLFSKIGRKNIAGLLDQRRNEIEKITVSGRTDKGLTRVLNSQGIVDKVTIKMKQGEDGLFNDEDVFSNLINEITKHE